MSDQPMHRRRWLVQGYLPFWSYVIGYAIYGALQKQPWQAAPGWIGWLPVTPVFILGVHWLYCMWRWDRG